MRTQHVEVLPYDPKWKDAFEKIKIELTDALGDEILGIEHVGSTAVAGLYAKPCIDIDVIIENTQKLDVVIAKLAAIGYVHEGDLGIKGREAFCYTDKPHLQTHHLYVLAADCPELHRHLTFRNYLRNHPEARQAYSQVKQEAAASFPDDIDQYIAYKSTCIDTIYQLCGLKNISPDH